MPQVRRDDIGLALRGMNSKLRSDWIGALACQQAHYGTIAHFGCANGAETLALLAKFHPTTIFGIDRDVADAQRINDELKDWVSETLMALESAPPGEQACWETSAPWFLKECRYPRYVQEPDIAQPQLPHQIPTSSVELSCCSNLLYQVLETQGEHALTSAIKEMGRVALAAGSIVADEPDNGKRQRMATYFEQAGLEIVMMETVQFNPGLYSTRYFARKPH